MSSQNRLARPVARYQSIGVIYTIHGLKMFKHRVGMTVHDGAQSMAHLNDFSDSINV